MIHPGAENVARAAAVAALSDDSRQSVPRTALDAKSRLLDRMTASAPITLISGVGGSGKTSVLAAARMREILGASRPRQRSPRASPPGPDPAARADRFTS